MITLIKQGTIYAEWENLVIARIPAANMGTHAHTQFGELHPAGDDTDANNIQ